MSDLAATNCGCGCNGGMSTCGGNSCCNIIIWIIILSALCGNNGGFGSVFSNNGCGDDCGSGFGGNSCIWLILILLFCGGNGGCGCGCN